MATQIWNGDHKSVDVIDVTFTVDIVVGRWESNKFIRVAFTERRVFYGNEIAEIAIIIIDCDGIVPNESYFSKWMYLQFDGKRVQWQSSLNCSFHAKIDCILSKKK